MNDPQRVIRQFYHSFDSLDPENMISYYHPDIVFRDPAFGELRGVEVGNMWRMLCQSQNKNTFSVKAFNVKSDGDIASADWEAKYIFSKTKRPVHNKVSASFEFNEGKIIRHVDTFDLYTWSKQALGVTGFFIGWTPFFKNSLQTKTRGLLEKFSSNLVGVKSAE